MHNQPQFRAHHDSRNHGSLFTQSIPGPRNENISLETAAIVNQPPVGANPQLQVTADGRLFNAPGIYSTGLCPQLPHDAHLATLPYLAQAAYHARPDILDHLHNVPGLQSCRGSFSTNETVPGTPYCGSPSLRNHSTQVARVDRSPFGSTPSQQLPIQHLPHPANLPYKTIPVNAGIDALLIQHPAIPRAVPAVFTPRESMRTLDQSLSNPIAGNRNVYIRGLHPNTDDETLAAYAARFGKVEISKAIIDTSTGACKGFGFAKYINFRDSELCIRGFYKLGYKVGFAREPFNSCLKAAGDEHSTNLYFSNLPKNMTESDLGTIFMDYTVRSSKILRDGQNNSQGVGFARFESREICEEVIKKFHGHPTGEEGLLLQVRYADTPAQRDLKRIRDEHRRFRTIEYNVGAYGTSALGVSPLAIPSPMILRTSQDDRYLPSA